MTSKLLSKEKEKLLPIAIGVVLTLLMAFLFKMNPEPVKSWLRSLEDVAYDLQLRGTYRHLSKTGAPIAIVDIDDKSIAEEGRWPWNRDKIGLLVEKLHDLGATVTAIDITFTEPEVNIADEVIQEIQKTPGTAPEALAELDKVKGTFDYDGLFAKRLAMGDSVLSIIFTNESKPVGILPPPTLELTPALSQQLDIPAKESYIGNIPILQNAAKYGGFINTTPDPDGVLRFSPLLIRLGNDVYSSLGLEAVCRYLLNKQVKLVTSKYGDTPVIEGIQLDNMVIPTDSQGRILIPFRGRAYTFPYVSASDVLKGTASKDAIEDKLIFIGSSASALGDLIATAIAPVFPGIEVHASIASGIMDHYLPYRPAWEKGVTLALILVLGIFFAFLLPHLGPVSNCVSSLSVPVALVLLNRWLWTNHEIVISIILPIALVLVLFVLNIAYGYRFESSRRKQMKSVFGQYVPATRLDAMLAAGGDFGLEGESKELSVLFADIRSFTNLSEKMTATQVKQFLNLYFTPMTEVIFNNKGTIDKYVGDMVMAFWGAPLDDPKNAFNSVQAALTMQSKLVELNQSFLKNNQPQISIGIGINTGQMNVGDMGSKFRRSYTVLGDAVNLASRLEGLCKYYHLDIIVGENTHSQTKEDFLYRKIDKVKVQGKDQAVEIYKPLCALSRSTSEDCAELDKHHSALEAYFRQDWDLSEKLFRELHLSYPKNQLLYAIYIERIANLRSSPPGKDWDGAYVRETK